MKFYLKLTDVLMQVLLIIANLYSLYLDFESFMPFGIHPIFILGGWQVLSNIINYLVGQEEATTKGRRRYTKSLLIGAGLWAIVLGAIWLGIAKDFFGGVVMLMLYAQILYGAIMAIAYLVISIQDAAHAFNKEHENINHRWMNL